MVLRESSAIWKDILGRKPEEQQDLLRWQLQAREPIRRLSDLKPGDHLLMTRNRGTSLEYAHHFLCIEIDETSAERKIIHYTAKDAFQQFFLVSFGSGSCLEQLGIIKKATLPDGDLIAKSDVDPKTTELLNGVEVERVVWPEELRRYSTEEVIERAGKRLKEKDYHLTNNNCESFVMWCLCDLNISLQVTSASKALCEAGSALIRTFWHGIQQIPKVVAEIWDDVAAAAAGRAVGETLSKLGISIGVVSTLVVEIIIAIVDIRKEYEKWRGGVLIKTRKEFIAEVVDKVILAICRAGGSIAGMTAGQIIIPVPVVGGLVGALVGMFGGHLMGRQFSKETKKAFEKTTDALIDEMKAKLKAHSRKFA